MPAVRFSRDKRGYEYTYLVHTPTRRGKPGRTRVLYWYRTPPGVRIGRQAFDTDVQKLIEVQNPGVSFNWDTIVNTPMPPPDMTEYWRERRRLEKAARQERRAMEAGDPVAESGETDAADGVDPVEDAVPEGEPLDEPLTEVADPVSAEPAVSADGATVADGAVNGAGPRKRRRRRGGRRRKPDGEADGGLSADAASGSAPEFVDGLQSEPVDPTSEDE